MALHDLTALEQASAIRAGETSSEELVRHYLDRAHRLNDAVGAYALISDELALAQAAAADASVRDVRNALLRSDAFIYAIAVPLACGNTVVLKASEQCPRTHALIVEAFAEAGFPDGVVQVVTNAPADAADVVGRGSSTITSFPSTASMRPTAPRSWRCRC